MNLEINAFDEALRSAREATKLYSSEGDDVGQGHAHVLASKGHAGAQEYDEAMQEADAAIKCFTAAEDKLGEAIALVALSTTYSATHDYLHAMNAADRAISLFVASGDRAKEVDAQILSVEAKINLNEANDDVKGYAERTMVLRCAEQALRLAKKERPKDRACIAAALYNYSRVLIRTPALKGAWTAAKQAARQFRKINNNQARARAMIIWSQADLLLGQPNEARANAQLAWTIFEKAGDDIGQTMASLVCDDIDRYLGIPTAAELQAQKLREQEAQREYMLQMQSQMALGNSAPIDMSMRAPQNLPEHDAVAIAKEGMAAFKRDGSPLTLSASMDPSVVRNKILDIATQIIGDGDDIEGDVPLMEAGLTSNTAVLLRDELGKDLPGIKLPPTLIFDYPSIASITDYVMEQSGGR